MPYQFPIAPPDVPFITTEQMREVDRAMIEDIGITLLQMMEHAGRNLADVVIRVALGIAISSPSLSSSYSETRLPRDERR